MGNRNAPGAMEVNTISDYEAMVIGGIPTTRILAPQVPVHYGPNKEKRLYGFA